MPKGKLSNTTKVGWGDIANTKVPTVAPLGVLVVEMTCIRNMDCRPPSKVKATHDKPYMDIILS